jgi:hypothetical protein
VKAYGNIFRYISGALVIGSVDNSVMVTMLSLFGSWEVEDAMSREIN